ncbi:hypothetical protein MTR_0046s0090 [Medicago truncatula]|uniref:Uncharacterized protein n=1 Tax=Medicago truncatula TaxID=3880 RepID=A0A072THQ0_MEDTR|nr:hypothetical protein MTR_0046s0090 [Medicago truncatula]
MLTKGKGSKKLFSPPLSILKKDHPKEDEEMTSNFIGSDPSLDIVCNVVSVLPVEYDVQSKVNEVENDSMKLHLKPLFIQAKINGVGVNKVLVDGGATVNLLPQSFLGNIGLCDSDLKPHNVILTNYEGTSGNSLGAIELEQRMDTWCGRSPSTMHQRIAIWKNDGFVENVEANHSYFLAEVNTITKKNFDKQLAHITPVMSPGAGFVWEREFREHDYVMVNQQEIPSENEDVLKTRAFACKKTMTEPNIWEKITAYLAENKFKAAKEAENLQQEVIEKLTEESADDIIEDQRLDCIYDDEPLGFEEDPMGSTTKMKAQGPLEEIDLGNGTVKKPTYISAKIPKEFKDQIAELLKEYKDCFA